MENRGLYEERTGWAWWVHLLVSITLVAVVIPLVELANGNIGSGPGAMPVWVAVLCAFLGLGLPGGIYAFMGQLRSRVTEQAIEIRWGFLEVIKKEISLDSIETAEAVTYSPLGEFGGWGIRFGGKKKKAWTVRGNRALLLHLKDGTKFYLGSDKPERLLQWVASGKKRRDG